MLSAWAKLISDQRVLLDFGEQKLDICVEVMKSQDNMFIDAAMLNEQCPPDYAWDNSTREGPAHYVIQEVLTGTCIFTQVGVQRPVAVGQAFIFQHGEDSNYHRGLYDQSMLTLNWIAMSGGIVEGVLAAIRKQYGSIIPLNNLPRFRALYRLAIKSYLRPRENRWQEARRVAELVLTLGEELESLADNDRIEVCRRRIAHDFRSGFNVKELASEAGLTQEHLTREFKLRFGQSPASLLREARYQYAIDLIQHHGIDRATAAAMSGFRDVRSLSRMIKSVAK